MVMKYWLRLLLITSQVIRKTWCTGRSQHRVTVRMLRVCKRAAFRNMRLWCGSAAATFGRHRSPKSRWSGEGWRDWPRWALVFSAHRSWRLGRSPRERASALRLPCFPSVTSSRERPICFFLLVSKWAQLATDTAGKPHLGLTGGARRRTKTVSLPVASRGPQTHWGKHELVSWLSNLPPSLMEIRGPRARLWDPHVVTV